MHCNSITNIALHVTLVFALGCGQSDEEKIELAMNQMQADQLAKSKLMASAADSLYGIRSQRSPVRDSGDYSQPLSSRELKSLLPENVADMNRADIAAGNEGGILLTITDLGSLKGVTAMPEYRWATSDVDRMTENGYEKSIIYKGYRGIEKYDHAQRNGEIQILVAGRFVVQAQGFKMSIDEIKTALNDVDLERLTNAK